MYGPGVYPEIPAEVHGRPVAAGQGLGQVAARGAGPAERLRPRQAVAAAADPRELRRRRDRPRRRPSGSAPRSRRRRWRCSTASSSTTRPPLLAARLRREAGRRSGRSGSPGAPADDRPAADRRRGPPRRRPDRPRSRRATAVGGRRALKAFCLVALNLNEFLLPGLNRSERRSLRHEPTPERLDAASPETSAAGPAASSSGKPAPASPALALAGPARRATASSAAAADGGRGRARSPTRSLPSRRTSRRRRRASSSCSCTAGPSHVDTFDYKPEALRARRQDDPREDLRPRRQEERGAGRRAEVEVQAVRPVRQVGQRPLPATWRPASTTSRSSTR